MTNVTGVIQYINEKQGQFGVSYNIKVDGTAYYLGKVNPTQKYGVVKGDTVTFAYETNASGFNNVKGPVKKVDGVAAPATPARPQPAAAGAPAPSNSRYNPEAEKIRQEVISRQAAANTAIAFLELAQKANALPTPKTKGDGFDVLQAMFEKLRDELFEYSMGRGKASAPAAPGSAESFKELENDDEWKD